MSKIIDWLKSHNWRAILTFLIVIGLGALDAINKAYGKSYFVPEWVWPILAAFGIFVNPRKPVPPKP